MQLSLSHPQITHNWNQNSASLEKKITKIYVHILPTTLFYTTNRPIIAASPPTYFPSSAETMTHQVRKLHSHLINDFFHGAEQVGGAYAPHHFETPPSPTHSHLCAGGPSIIMLIHRICIAFRGFSKWKIVEAAIRERAATDLKGGNSLLGTTLYPFPIIVSPMS